MCTSDDVLDANQQFIMRYIFTHIITQSVVSSHIFFQGHVRWTSFAYWLHTLTHTSFFVFAYFIAFNYV